MRLTVFLVAATLYVVHMLRVWRNHYLRAQATGLPCVIVPALPMSPMVRILMMNPVSLLKRLPITWTPAWLRHLDLMSGWHDGYGIYKRMGADSYVLVAPIGIMLVTCAPDAIDEILHRRDVFPRPVELFRPIGRNGNNLACIEGAQWRRTRRIVSSAFGDRNNREVWLEALYQAPRIVQSWTPGQRIPLNVDTRRISQNIMSKAGFGYRMEWGNNHVTCEETKHRGMTYIEAARGLVRNILPAIVIPELLLSR